VLSRKGLVSLILPLPAAYQFAAANGLGIQAQAIRKKSLRWKSRTSSVRAGYMILLLQSKGLFEKIPERVLAEL
jgi:hypothetical protein